MSRYSVTHMFICRICEDLPQYEQCLSLIKFLFLNLHTSHILEGLPSRDMNSCQSEDLLVHFILFLYFSFLFFFSSSKQTSIHSSMICNSWIMEACSAPPWHQRTIGTKSQRVHLVLIQSQPRSLHLVRIRFTDARCQTRREEMRRYLQRNETSLSGASMWS